MPATTEQLLHQSQQRFNAAVEAVNGIMWTANGVGEMVGEQKGWSILTGQTLDEYQHFGWSKVIHADDLQLTFEAWRAAIADKTSFSVEHRVRRDDGDWRLYLVRGIPVHDADGDILEWVGVHIDITDERKTQHRLARTAENLSLALDAGEIGLWEIDLLSGANTWDERLFGLWGITGPDAPPLDTIFGIVDARDRDDVTSEMAQLQQPGSSGVFDSEFRIVRASDGEERWLSARGKTLGNMVPAKLIFGATRDITDRKRRDEQIRFLMGELTHRTKNILAIIQAIARQTARDATSVQSFSEAFAQRVTAVAGSLDLLIKENWSSASLLELVRVQTSPIVGEDGTRIKLTGKDIALLPDAAQNLGLALHELSTNAAKYGALSAPGGHIALGWWIADGAGDEKTGNEKVFSLVWKELGGPPVSQPTRQGFGHTVMNRLVKAALTGDATLAFEPDGVRWSVRIPVSQILQPAGRPGLHATP